MTKVTVNAGICGYTVEITAEKGEAKKIHITLDTECRMIKNMSEDTASLDMMSVFTGFLNNPVYKSAAMHIRHVACPVPSGIIKAIEVEAGLCIPKDAEIIFQRAT